MCDFPSVSEEASSKVDEVSVRIPFVSFLLPTRATLEFGGFTYFFYNLMCGQMSLMEIVTELALLLTCLPTCVSHFLFFSCVCFRVFVFVCLSLS